MDIQIYKGLKKEYSELLEKMLFATRELVGDEENTLKRSYLFLTTHNCKKFRKQFDKEHSDELSRLYSLTVDKCKNIKR